MTYTRTYAKLPVSPAAFDEIREKMEKAGYEVECLLLDMHGIALEREAVVPCPLWDMLGLKHYEDLVEFDGPLVSLAVSPAGTMWLTLWCDVDWVKKQHTWIAFEIDRVALECLKSGVSSLRSIMLMQSRVMLVKTGSVNEVRPISIVDVPIEYWPSTESYIA